MNANLSWGWDHDLARKLAQAVNWAAGNPVTLPDGVGGYAFEAKGMTFLVLEDLKYTGGAGERAREDAQRQVRGRRRFPWHLRAHHPGRGRTEPARHAAAQRQQSHRAADGIPKR